VESAPISWKKKREKKPTKPPDLENGDEYDVPLASSRKKKPRIKISLTDGGEPGKRRRGNRPGKRGRPSEDGEGKKGESDDDVDVVETPIL
jgi:hypothetical protein